MSLCLPFALLQRGQPGLQRALQQAGCFLSRLVSKKTLKQGRRPHGPRCVQLHHIRLGLRTSLSTVAPIHLIAFRLNTSSTPGLPQGNLCFHRDWSHRHGDAQGVRAALSRTQPLQSRGDLQVGADGRLLGDPAGESSRSRERERERQRLSGVPQGSGLDHCLSPPLAHHQSS